MVHISKWAWQWMKTFFHDNERLLLLHLSQSLFHVNMFPLYCVCCVRELPRQASCGPLYLSRVLERDWCLLNPRRPARWPLMGTVLILSKCTLLLLWTSREREDRKSRTKKGRGREKDKKKRGKECEKNWKTDQQEPESKISKSRRVGYYRCTSVKI